jgi:serine/threonine protein phosphatase PrpC
MRTDKTTGGLLAAATTSNKIVNQDASALARNSVVPLAGIILADGLGSHYGAEIASRVAATSLRDALELIERACEVDVPHLFANAQQCLERYVGEHAEELPADLDWANAFGTTLLSVIETNDQILIGYLGNGAIFHIRGNFNTFPASQLLPWTAVNYLNPHSVSKAGKNVLYKLLSARSHGSQIDPTVLKLRKDIDVCGDIVLLCSDGIYSFDQTPMGRDSEDNIWISGEESMWLFFEALKGFFVGRDHAETNLQDTIEAYLAELKTRNLVSDDCALGVLITEKALRYQESLRNGAIRENSQ